ncbi:PIN domain-containing protein [Candidatus Parabeggiatoa sp. HSG14]|uniref:type II toxin-antitoxin system VapC family toxin n=1 Tax=Candidatus Parabeggiatoa sp. HSG14 TaxID=3055593 RepID=UPI0025A6D460|nr:PIN domain-containing protein [Thiotrichales bacterium HSG14]
MIIYLDSSALNRIFDDQTQARIYLESSSMLLVFMLIENGFVDIVSSDALVFEKSQNPHDERRMFVSLILQKAKAFKSNDEKTLKRAEEIEQQYGIKGMDALHLACAEQLQVDAFITCDDKMIKRYMGLLSVINPVTFTMDFLQQVQNQ